ncbi:hypothetical protein ABIE50_000724 [Chitinophaga sp. OAE865]
MLSAFGDPYARFSNVLALPLHQLRLPASSLIDAETAAKLAQLLVSVSNEKKAFRANPLKAFSTAWSHQGMILGPPDYESGALTN